MDKFIIPINLSSQEIYDTQFKVLITNAYDAYEVDEFLDRIISDYEKIEANYLVEKKFIDSLIQENNNLKKRNDELQIIVQSYQARYDRVNDHPEANVDNIHLLKKIDKLEKHLWKLGVNPNTIK